jgi:hypothetical protein
VVVPEAPDEGLQVGSVAGLGGGDPGVELVAVQAGDRLADAQPATRQLRGFDDSSGQVRQQPLQAASRRKGQLPSRNTGQLQIQFSADVDKWENRVCGSGGERNSQRRD